MSKLSKRHRTDFTKPQQMKRMVLGIETLNAAISQIKDFELFRIFHDGFATQTKLTRKTETSVPTEPTGSEDMGNSQGIGK